MLPFIKYLDDLRDSKRELERIAEEATTDCYGEYRTDGVLVLTETVTILDRNYRKYLAAYREWL